MRERNITTAFVFLLITMAVFSMTIIGCEEETPYNPEPSLPKGGNIIIHGYESYTAGYNPGAGYSLYFDLWLDGRKDYTKEWVLPNKSFSIFGDWGCPVDTSYRYILYTHIDFDFNKPLREWDSGSGRLTGGRTVNIRF